MNVAFHLSDHNIIFIAKGKTYNVSREHTNFEVIREQILTNQGTEDELIELADIPTTIYKVSNGKIEVVNGAEVHYEGKPLHNVWTERLLKFMKEGVTIDPLLIALESLQRNPSYMARERLPLFQETNLLGFLPDGLLTGLKAVKHNFMDKRTGKIDNSPGKFISMPRHEISDDPDLHCHTGLHVGSWDYVSSFASNADDRIILVAFWPEDVVCVPRDLQTKIRVCAYESLSELQRSDVELFIQNNQVLVDASNGDEDEVY